ncbi:MAG: class I SAM-dependent methyltransferase [Mobilitalea sp.]
MRCAICDNNEGNRIHEIKEMMFGSGSVFNYIECHKCGCLQIQETPKSISSFYPEQYYSYHYARMLTHGLIKMYLKGQRTRYYLERKGILGYLMAQVTTRPYFMDYLTKANMRINSAILDVGCGDGKLLNEIRREGVINVSGIDPFIPRDMSYPNGVSVYKKSLDSLDQQYDLIMLHHSFEHMPEPFDVMRTLYKATKNGGCVLIRIPVTACYAWRTYGVEWVQLDAPRHLFIHTEKSMTLLAEKSGFKIRDVVYDSNELQFWGSEQYRRGIALMDDRSYSIHPEKSIFSKEQITIYRSKALKLNQKKDGDTACFYLSKVDE